MKKLLPSALFVTMLASGFSAGAQTFNSSTTGPIQDNQVVCVPVTVTGLATSIDTGFGLCQVCINITHTYIGDLDVYLVSPSGDSIMLSNNQGGGGDNYTGTCFRMDAPTAVTAGTAPYTGNYVPENSLNLFNDGQDPNGTWTLCVRDEAPADTGIVNSVSLNFCSAPPVDPPWTFGPCSVNNGNGCLCPDSVSTDCDLLPDMTASADIITNSMVESPGQVDLSNATPNIGWGPMEIHSSGSCWCDTVSVPCSTTLCPSGNPPTEKLLQRLYHKNGNTITSFDTLTPGTMSYHPTHGHVHVNNWAWFTLRTATSNPDATTWPIVSTGSKTSFCLINLGDCTSNLGYCRDSLGNTITMADIPNAPFGLVSGCGTSQGIYTGMLDIYSIGLPDMFIPMDVCNGNYYIVSITDPDNNFVESNENNNWVAVPITLTMQSNPLNNPSFNTMLSNMTVNTSYNNTNVTSVVWDFGDGNMDSTNNPAFHTYGAPGTYTITLTVTNPCGSYSSTQVVTVTGLKDDPAFVKSLLKTYPNPNSGQATIEYTLPQGGKTEIEIYNVLGEKTATVFSGEKSAGKYELAVDFDALHLPDGNYFIRLKTNGFTSTQKITCIR
ncbi:MAG: Spore coat protein CotH [Bacteroidetes bacterium]|nr:MAG: Spore coat protein CotH [Bacteroidota bacterium]